MPHAARGRQHVVVRGEGDSPPAIRLQDYVDADLLPSNDGKETTINVHIQRAQEALDRAAQSTGANVATTLHPRHWKERSPPREGSISFAVAQFNTLARGLSSGPVDPPFPREESTKDAAHYGGFTRLVCPESVLDFDVRKWRLLQVMLGGGLNDTVESDVGDGGPAFDILALEEADEYLSFFRPALTNEDDAGGLNVYRGVFEPKRRSPCVSLGYYSDGVVLLWNPEKFHIISRPSSSDAWIEKGAFGGSNQVYVIVPLQIRDTGKCVVVAATHLKAKKGAANAQLRHSQALELRRRVEQTANTMMEKGWKDVSVLILGDFNSEPDEASVKCILSQDECDDGEKARQYQSAYPLDEQSNELFTTWKTRKEGTARRIIDYIFHASSGAIEGSEGIRCTHYLSVPHDEEVEEGGFPGFRYPSDHLLVAAKYDC